MSRVLFSVQFCIQRIIQGMIQNMANVYSASGSGLRVLFKIRPTYYSGFGSGFRVLLKNVQCILQRLVQDSAYYPGYYSYYEQPIIQRLVILAINGYRNAQSYYQY